MGWYIYVGAHNWCYGAVSNHGLRTTRRNNFTHYFRGSRQHPPHFYLSPHLVCLLDSPHPIRQLCGSVQTGLPDMVTQTTYPYQGHSSPKPAHLQYPLLHRKVLKMGLLTSKISFQVYAVLKIRLLLQQSPLHHLMHNYHQV